MGTLPLLFDGPVMTAFREQLLATVGGHRGVVAANRLCEACVRLLGVDAAAISLVFDGVATGTVGSSGVDARALDELQFTVGEGPCLESVALCSPVMVPDLSDPAEQRWPVYRRAMLDLNVRSVHAIPVVIAGEYVGTLDLFRALPGRLHGEQFAGAVVAAELAGMAVLDLLDSDLQAAVSDPGSTAWTDLKVLSRAEIGQATGMLVAQLNVEPAEALIRLRAHAYATDSAATEVARDILDRRLVLE